MKLGRRHSLLEVVVALGLLILVLLGVMAVVTSSRTSLTSNAERRAAAVAAAATLDQLESIARVDFDQLATLYHETGFDVGFSPDGEGVAQPGLKKLAPGSDQAYPASRAGKASGVKAQAGYIEVNPVPGRTDLVDVTVVVGWRSAAQAGRDDRLVLTLRIGKGS